MTNVLNGSVDVKFYDASGAFVMFEILDTHTASSQLAVRVSTDGVNWSASQSICATNCFPDWANNIGVSSDDRGHLISGKILLSYGAPYDLGSETWGSWDLYGQFIGLGSDATGSQGEIPIFRFYNPVSGEHFFTSDSSEGISIGYQAENWGWPVFSVFSNAFAGSRPLYRCIAGYWHFVSNYADCEGQTYEALYGYIYDYGNQVAGSMPLHRLYRPANGDHLISLSPTEGSGAGYIYVVMMGYVPP